jgi:hypothetical protein
MAVLSEYVARVGALTEPGKVASVIDGMENDYRAEGAGTEALHGARQQFLEAVRGQLGHTSTPELAAVFEEAERVLTLRIRYFNDAIVERARRG